MNVWDDIAKFIANAECEHCGQHYEPGNINVVGQLVDLLLFTTYCPSCNNTGSAVINTMGKKETETTADLTEAGETHFFKPVSSSDIVDMHNFLEDFEGDFANLFTVLTN